MVDYTNTFTQLGAELKILREIEALFENAHFSDSATYQKRLIDSAYSSSVNEEDEAKTLGKAASEATAGQLRALHLARRGFFEQGFFPVLDQEIPPTRADIAAGAIKYSYDATLQADGQISISARNGRWGLLRNQMIDDSEVVIKNRLTFGSLTAQGTNLGAIVVAGSPTLRGSDHTPTGTIVFEVNDDTVDFPKLKVSIELTKDLIEGETVRLTERLLQIGKEFEEGRSGLTIELDLDAIVKTNDAGSAIMTVPVVTKPTEADTDKGQIFVKMTRQAAAPTWLIEWYNDSDTDSPTNLVQRTTADGVAGTTDIAMTRNTTLEFTFSNVNAAADMPLTDDTRTITLDIGSPRKGDRWTMTVSNDEAGKIATKIGRRYPASLASGPAKPASALTATLAAGAGNVDNGTHSYKTAYIDDVGDEGGGSAVSNTITVIDKTINGKVDLTVIPTGPAGTAKRRVYRTLAGAAVAGPWYFLTEIADNVTTIYTDNTADSGLGDPVKVEIDDTLASSVSIS